MNGTSRDHDSISSMGDKGIEILDGSAREGNSIDYAIERGSSSISDGNDGNSSNDGRGRGRGRRSERRKRVADTSRKRLSTARVERLIRQLLIELGEDPDREGLVDTPERVAEMYAEIFSGYTMDSELDVTFSEESDVVVAREIQFYSMCEHHILPFFGKVHIAYIPDGRVFGISKLVRLVEKYAKRLQIQERMTKQIADELKDRVRGVLVVVEGDHMCMRMRGVRNSSRILTIAYRGEFENRELREQILSLLIDGNNARMHNA